MTTIIFVSFKAKLVVVLDDTLDTGHGLTDLMSCWWLGIKTRVYKLARKIMTQDKIMNKVQDIRE